MQLFTVFSDFQNYLLLKLLNGFFLHKITIDPLLFANCSQRKKILIFFLVKEFFLEKCQKSDNSFSIDFQTQSPKLAGSFYPDRSNQKLCVNDRVFSTVLIFFTFTRNLFCLECRIMIFIYFFDIHVVLRKN